MSRRSSRYHVTVVSPCGWVETSHHSRRPETLKYAQGATSRGFIAVKVQDAWTGEILFTWAKS